MRSRSPAGLVGRGIAAIGAALLAGSLFLTAFNFDDNLSYWDAYRRMDVVVLALAIAAVLFLLLSLVVLQVVFLFFVGAIGGFGLGFFFKDLYEFDYDEGVGAYLANVGSAALFVGAAIALLAAVLGRANRPRDVAFVPADPEPDTPTVATPAYAGPDTTAVMTPPAEAEPEPEAVTAATTTEAGWYADPSGQARLRYWDGQAWTEQTQD